MADSVTSAQSPTPDAVSTKRRANTVSTETENKLARAARSAQRLAELSEPSHDDSTPDLFSDDSGHATLEAMNIDLRQRTLDGFELPDEMLAAVGAAAVEGPATLPEAKAVRRTSRERSEADPAATLAKVTSASRGKAADATSAASAAAFADTVDALYGVISDQRRAAIDDSRRMKRMLAIVVGVLLVTVVIGVTQTVQLMRLTRETVVQQHRVEEMMQNQQAAMISLLDTHLAAANALAAAPSAVVTTRSTPTAPVAPVAPRQATSSVTSTPASKHAGEAHPHDHKPKTPAAATRQ
jgi:hypothetical protein